MLRSPQTQMLLARDLHQPQTESAGSQERSADKDGFSSEYSERAGRLVRLVAALRAAGGADLGMEGDLPAVAVAGNQSAGKTSLLEALSGIHLPRAAGPCTRCAMELRMYEGVQEDHSRSKSAWSAQIRIRFEGVDGSSRETTFGPPIADRRHVAAAVLRAQRALLNPSTDPNAFLADPQPSDPDELQFANGAVCIDVFGAPASLALVDLPGFVRSLERPQDAHCIGRVSELVRSYLERPRTLIVAVISCKDEIENQAIVHLARELDPSGSRTIGVLTKPDTIEQADASRWIDIFIGRSFPLRLGYFFVKCPSSAEATSGCSPEDARRIESSFFASSRILAPVRHASDRLGVPALRSELARLLTNLISQSLPAIKIATEKAINSTIQELSHIPPIISDNPRIELLQMIRHFCALISNNINADHDFKIFYQRIRSHFDLLQDRISATRPSFDLEKKGFLATTPAPSQPSLASANQPNALGIYGYGAPSSTIQPILRQDSSTSIASSSSSTSIGTSNNRSMASSAWTAAASSLSLASSLSMAIPNRILSSITGSSEDLCSNTQPENRETPKLKSPRSGSANRFIGLSSSTYIGTTVPEKLDAHKPFTISDLRRIIESQKGRELHGYSPYSAFTSLVHACQEDWSHHASTCLEAVSYELTILTNELVHEVFARFAGLHGKISLAIQTIQTDLNRVTTDQINHLLAMERRYPFTLNSNAFMERKMRFLSALDRNPEPSGSTMNAPSTSTTNPSAQKSNLFSVVHPLDPAITDLMTSSLSYMEIAISRVSDTIPMTIEYHFLSHFNTLLEKHLLSHLGVLDASLESLRDLLVEERSVIERRRIIEARRERLETAWKSLHEFGV